MSTIAITKSLATQRKMVIFSLLGASVLLGAFVTNGFYAEHLEAAATFEDTVKTMDSKKSLLDALNATRQQIESDANIQADIVRYASEYRENEIIDSIFAKFPGISISNIAFDKGEKLPNGLSRATVSLSIQSKDIPTLNSYLEYLTSDKSTKRYLIQALNFPFDLAKNTPFGASLQLGLYYLSK